MKQFLVVSDDRRVGTVFEAILTLVSNDANRRNRLSVRAIMRTMKRSCYEWGDLVIAVLQRLETEGLIVRKGCVGSDPDEFNACAAVRALVGHELMFLDAEGCEDRDFTVTEGLVIARLMERDDAVLSSGFFHWMKTKFLPLYDEAFPKAPISDEGTLKICQGLIAMGYLRESDDGNVAWIPLGKYWTVSPERLGMSEADLVEPDADQRSVRVRSEVALGGIANVLQENVGMMPVEDLVSVRDLLAGLASG